MVWRIPATDETRVRFPASAFFLFPRNQKKLQVVRRRGLCIRRLSLVVEHLSCKQKVKGSIPLIAFFSSESQYLAVSSVSKVGSAVKEKEVPVSQGQCEQEKREMRSSRESQSLEQKHLWSNGMTYPCHGWDPGSIPGKRIFLISKKEIKKSYK